MSRNITASDRKNLIRLASALPKGSPERRAILAGLKKAGAQLASILQEEGLLGKEAGRHNQALVTKKQGLKVYTSDEGVFEWTPDQILSQLGRKGQGRIVKHTISGDYSSGKKQRADFQKEVYGTLHLKGAKGKYPDVEYVHTTLPYTLTATPKWQKGQLNPRTQERVPVATWKFKFKTR